MASLPDGLTALREVMPLGEAMRLIERTAQWVDPATFRLLPVWYPEHARRRYFYKANWSAPQRNRNRQSGHEEHKREGNVHANKALTAALGLSSAGRQNWSCCHIWGVDDPTFQEANDIVQDPRYFSCVANMILLPTPLKAFTDAMPEVKGMLRAGARDLYGWVCDHDGAAGDRSRLDVWAAHEAYPRSWAGGEFPGVRPLTPTIRLAVERRIAALRRDLIEAGPYYPRDVVRATLAHWRVDVDGEGA